MRAARPIEEGEVESRGLFSKEKGMRRPSSCGYTQARQRCPRMCGYPRALQHAGLRSAKQSGR
eukprot:856757-Pyramimonas_sp.AAC.1